MLKSIGLDVFGLFVLPGSELMWGLLLGILPEIAVGMFLWNKRLRKSLRKDIRTQLLSDVDEGLLDPAIERATSKVQGQVEEVHELVMAQGVQEQVGTIQAKLEALDEALGQHLQALHDGLETLPQRVRSSLGGKQGAEIKQLYKEASEAEMELVEEYEAALTPGERALAKFDGLTETEGFQKYEGSHPIGGTIVRGLKEIIKGEIEARRGVIPMRRTGTKGGFPNVYG